MNFTNKIFCGHAIEQLEKMPSESVHCVCTSPPYFNQMTYVGEKEFNTREGTEEWSATVARRWNERHGTERINYENLPAAEQKKKNGSIVWFGQIQVNALFNDGWFGPYGNEPSVGMYVEHTVDVFRSIRRVLRADGTVWLNIGDAYLKNKQLGLVPARVAIALQEDGWIVRNDNVWAKTNPKPDTAGDRLSRAHEFVFLLSKSEKYFFDQVAIREPSKYKDKLGRDTGRNMRTVWNLNVAFNKSIHCAVFPDEIPERAIRAGTSTKGCCPSCGSPWTRVVNKKRVATRPGTDSKVSKISQLARGDRDPSRHVTYYKTVGWKPSCKCGFKPIPCTVLDPFCGSGTSLRVAAKLRRSFVGCEATPSYCKISKEAVKPYLSYRIEDYIQ